MSSASALNEESQQPRLVAVIDIGATSIRMAIAQLSLDGMVQVIESLAQAVHLGVDTFSTGCITRATIEDCVEVLTTYRHKLDEYRFRGNDQIRVVATSAVREASNTLAFQDRVYLATGFVIQPFDEAELHRATYLGIQPFLDDFNDDLTKTMIYELGGGSTEVLVLQHDDVLFAQTFRLGVLRLHVAQSAYGVRPGLVAERDYLESQIEQAIKRIKSALGDKIPSRLIAMGGEIRLAASEITKQQPQDHLLNVPREQLKKFAERILEKSVERLVRTFHMDIATAELFGPALLVHVKLAQAFGVDPLLVANVNLRDGLILEMTKQRVWTERIQDQIVRWAINLGRKYQFDEPHARCVARLAEQLFDQLGELHRLEPRFRAILYLAALLHEIGLYVDSRGYHKHTMYLIANSDFFGIGAKDLQLISLVARYHRRASPQPSHEGYSLLDRNDRVAVTKLASLLRIARCLDVSRNQHIQDVKCEVDVKRVNIHVHSPADLSLEQIELQKDATLFCETFGRSVRLVVSPD